MQGRYDVVCPPKAAWLLHKALPQSKLYYIPDAGHSALVSAISHRFITEMLTVEQEPGTESRLRTICDEILGSETPV